MKEQSLRAGWYRHFKGGLYYVLMVATDEADGQPRVIYRSSDNKLWTRPLDDFIAEVDVIGGTQPRFKPV